MNDLERLTVNLTRKGSQALAEAMEITGDSKTDVVNQALRLYALVERALDNGGRVHVQDGPDAERESIRLI